MDRVAEWIGAIITGISILIGCVYAGLVWWNKIENPHYFVRLFGEYYKKMKTITEVDSDADEKDEDMDVDEDDAKDDTKSLLPTVDKINAKDPYMNAVTAPSYFVFLMWMFTFAYLLFMFIWAIATTKVTTVESFIWYYGVAFGLHCASTLAFTSKFKRLSLFLSILQTGAILGMYWKLDVEYLVPSVSLEKVFVYNLPTSIYLIWTIYTWGSTTIQTRKPQVSRDFMILFLGILGLSILVFETVFYDFVIPSICLIVLITVVARNWWYRKLTKPTLWYTTVYVAIFTFCILLLSTVNYLRIAGLITI